MESSTQIEKIRAFIQDRFHRMGAVPTTALRETLLIRDGNYCGHRFQQETLQAVWFIEEDQIKFFGRDGELVESLRPSTDLPAEHQKAA